MDNQTGLKLAKHLQAQIDAVSKQVGPSGKDGKDGRDGKDGAAGPAGPAGPAGKDGKPGANGEDGEDGVSIVAANVDFDNHLYLEMSDGELIDAGEIRVEAGEGLIEIKRGGGGGGGGSSASQSGVSPFDVPVPSLARFTITTTDKKETTAATLTIADLGLEAGGTARFYEAIICGVRADDYGHYHGIFAGSLAVDGNGDLEIFGNLDTLYKKRTAKVDVKFEVNNNALDILVKGRDNETWDWVINGGEKELCLF